ncbi:MAG: hypothetical protein JWP87_6324 [Labilithrix sp.]|nr:hypothetical protein [Labilithrix sp.]
MPNSDALADSLGPASSHGRAHPLSARGASSSRLSARDATIEASSPVPTSSGVRPSASPSALLRELSRGWTFSDQHLALLVSAALFVVGAWPLALTEVPPYQDLPNHLAAVTVIENPGRYPEFVFNGFFKTNAALFAWLFVVGKVVGTKLAARLFALMVLAANAVVLPRFVLALTGSRKRMLIASMFMWPMVHNWFVSMGMLDFALSVPLSLGLLLAIDRHRRSPTLLDAGLVTALGAATWYAHVFPLLVVFMLVFIEGARAPSWRERFSSLKAMTLPLLPVAALVAISLVDHMRDNVGPMSAFVHHHKMVPPWELAYNLWAEWFWGFTKLSITSIVPCLLLAFYGFSRRYKSSDAEAAPAFFSTAAIVALLVLFCLAPYRITNWYHVNSRLIPYIWVALLLRVPDQLPKRVLAVLGISAVLYSAGMGADFIRLERDREQFTAGVTAVPEGAKLLPLVFRHKGVSDNTRTLLHAWGFYVTDKYTSAPLLFAHSRSFPVMYSTPPPARFNDLVLENFAATMITSANFCESTRVVTDDCTAEYRARWAEFWRDAIPRYDHVLLWEPSQEALELVPPDYGITFRQDGLVIMQRGAGRNAPVSASSFDPR